MENFYAIYSYKFIEASDEGDWTQGEQVTEVVVGTGAWVRGCYNSNMWLKYYNKMTDDDKNMLPLKRISFLGNNE